MSQGRGDLTKAMEVEERDERLYGKIDLWTIRNCKNRRKW